jgi:DNA-binding transcriptional MerR regulator
VSGGTTGCVASQLAELNRLIALKDLGFALQQVQAILAEQVSVAELRGMLRLQHLGQPAARGERTKPSQPPVIGTPNAAPAGP